MSVVTIGGAVAAGEAYGAYKAGQTAGPAVQKAVSTVTQPVTAAVSAGLEWARMSLTVIGWGVLGLLLVGAGISVLLAGRSEGAVKTVVKVLK